MTDVQLIRNTLTLFPEMTHIKRLRILHESLSINEADTFAIVARVIHRKNGNAVISDIVDELVDEAQ